MAAIGSGRLSPRIEPRQGATRTLEEGVRLCPEDIRGLVVDDHVARLHDNLLPLAERFHRMEAGIEALRHHRREPSVEVERAVPVALRVVRAGPATRDGAGRSATTEPCAKPHLR
jgi:hypothetical protein